MNLDNISSKVREKRNWGVIASLCMYSILLLVCFKWLIEAYISHKTALRLVEYIVWLATIAVSIAEKIYQLAVRQKTQTLVESSDAPIKTVNSTKASMLLSNLQRNRYQITVGIIAILVVHLIIYGLLVVGYNAGYIVTIQR